MKRVAIQPVLNGLLIVIMALGFLSPAQQTVSAATTLAAETITWNVIGLDSNNVYVGPNTFPVGARVCNIGLEPSGELTAKFVWDSSNAYINLSGASTGTLTYPGLAIGECTDFYYEVEVTRNPSAYDATRRYHIAVTESDNPTTFSTPIPRELYVERLISQSRNGQLNLELSTDGVGFTSFAAGDTLTLLKGETYFLRLTAATATNGYEQIESYLNLPNLYFRVLSVTTDYSVGTDSDLLYGDGCTWENDPNSPNYRSCLGTGKNGGDVITTYKVYIVDYRSGDPTPVNGMIYDFSGSSYHYNADYVGEARDLYNLDPEQIPFTKTFVPNAIVPGEVSQATFKITNPSSLLIDNVSFTDDLPGDMAVAPSPALSFTGCGASPSSTGVTDGSQSMAFANILLAPYATCTIKVNVTATTPAILINTTGPLNFSVDTNTYTGTTATDDLTVATNVRSCTTGSTLANWTVPVGAVSPPDILGGIPTVTGPQVTTAVAVGVGGGDETFAIDTAEYPGNPVWEVTGKFGDPGPYTNKYYQFTVDTTYYENIVWDLVIAELKNGPETFDITYDPPGAQGETLLATVTGVTGTLTPLSYTVGTGYLPAGNTVFRVYPYNARNNGKDAVAVVDAIHFTGDYCLPPPPSITKSFATDPILVNGESQLTFDISNTSTNPPSGALNGIAFTDTLPTGLTIAAGDQTNDCGGTLTATEGTSSISLVGGALAAGASCSISVPVAGITAGVFNNISERITDAESGENKTSSGFATDDITVIGPPSIIKTFAEETILTGNTTSLTFMVSNPNPMVTLTGVAFTDMLPTGLTVADSTPSAQCGGTLTTTAPETIQLSGASLEPYGNCMFSVTVTGAADSGGSYYTNTTGAVTSMNGGTGNTATDNLYVRDPQPGLDLLKQVGLTDDPDGPWYNYLVVEAGTPVYYKFTVENTGDVNLTNVVVTDPDMDPITVCTIATLEYASSPLSEPIAYCISGAVTTVSGGKINTASASAYYGAVPVFAPDDEAEYDTPNLSLVKTSLEKYYTAAGQVLNYSYLVTNNGAILQGPVTIIDDKTTVACQSLTTVGDSDDWFDTGESVTCTATYTTTALDVDVVNLATAYTGGFASNDATVTVPKLPANFGHLPSSFLNMNLFNDDGARHITDGSATGTYLGATVPVEADGINNSIYVSQGTDDGVTFRGTWTEFVGLARIGYHCPTGATCYLNGWLDWNGNNQFDLEDWIVKNEDVSGTGTTEYSFPIPAGTNVDEGREFFARFRIYAVYPGDSPQPYGQATDVSGQPTVGEVEDYSLIMDENGTPVHTPVTLSYFRAVRNGNNVTFNWSTATETGNVGFNLYSGDETARRLINPELIGSKVVDSLSRQDYTYTAAVRGNTFFIEDVSVADETKVHGPFQLGREYGDKAQNDVIEWNLIQGESNAKDTTRQRDLAPGLTVTNTKKVLTSVLNFQVSKTGIYRVTYEMLKAAGYDLKGVQIAKMGLTSNGKAVPIYTYGKTVFGPGSYIEFYGQALDTLYTDTNIYTLQTNATKPARIKVDTKRPTSRTTFAASYIETVSTNNQKAYSYSAPGQDPWYDSKLLVYTTPKIWTRSVTIEGLANTSSPTSINLTLWGGTDFPQSPDHHVQVAINDRLIADEVFDGAGELSLNLTLPAGVLIEGSNLLKFTLPGDTGVAYDLQHLDQYSISYPRLFKAKEGKLVFTASGAGYKVTQLPTSVAVVYRLDPSGVITKLTPTVTKAADGSYSAAFLGAASNSTYFVSSTTALQVPGLNATRVKVDLNKKAEYLIISHPDFIANLQPFVAARQEKYTVSVVDVMDLYTQYSFGVFDPDAIRQYIKFAAQNLGTKYILLVGGDTFDYHNYTNKNSISFIPSLYAATGPLISYAPADPLFTDFNGDSIPDLAIGRFPVRTAAELDLIIQKTLAYERKDYGQTAVFASDKYDQGYSFKQISDSMVASLPASWAVENLSLENLDLATARTNLFAAMNQGTALVNYTGHSGPADWTFSGLFNQSDISKLTNSGRPFVVVQWGCWNTYHVYPNYNFLVQNFLFTGDNGAVAVLGATSLSTVDSEELLGKILTPKLATPGMTLGQAIQDAKVQLSLTHPEMLDVLLGWSLMGDPALMIEP
jgi:uncharacterized repeat protein (TIGR01451 family)